jgi:hypothetical protein
MKFLYFLAGLFLLVTTATAQVNIGSNTAPNANAALELSSGGNKGLLLPRVNLSATTSPAPLAAHIAGMMVYNLAGAGSGDSLVVPGVYINTGTSWQLLASYAGAGVATALNCNTGNAALGTYQEGIPTTNANTKDISVTITNTGAYSIVSDTQNGVTFKSSGAFINTGAATILLTAAGTPLIPGTFTYNILLDNIPCSFDVVYAPPAFYNCTGRIITQNPTGPLQAGTAYTGTFTLPYTAGNGTAYASISQTIDGLTLTRVAGTYLPGGGNVIYNLAGTFTNVSSANATFTIPGCTIAVFGMADAIRDALATSNGGSLAAYDAAAVNDWIRVSPAEYNAVTTLVGGAQKCGTQDSVINLYTIFQPLHVLAQFITASVYPLKSSPVPASSYIFAATFIPTTNPFGTDNGALTGAKIKLGQTSSTNFDFTVNNILPTLTILSTQRVYYICKRPSTASPANRTNWDFGEAPMITPILLLPPRAAMQPRLIMHRMTRSRLICPIFLLTGNCCCRCIVLRVNSGRGWN